MCLSLVVLIIFNRVSCKIGLPSFQLDGQKASIFSIFCPQVLGLGVIILLVVDGVPVNVL